MKRMWSICNAHKPEVLVWHQLDVPCRVCELEAELERRKRAEEEEAEDGAVSDMQQQVG